MRTNVVSIAPKRPRTFTRAEELIDTLREHILTSGETYEKLSERAGCSTSTVNNLCIGRTKWPRPQTLFGLLEATGYGLSIVSAK